METLKIVVVGDGAVGKTYMLETYTTNVYPSHYIPTVIQNYSSTITVDGKETNLDLWTAAGQDDYDKLRPLLYPGTNVFLLCFSITQPCSLANIARRWAPELMHHCPNIPIILVATKLDMRNPDEDTERENVIISYKDGFAMSEKINAVKYLECSSRTRQGLRNIIDEAVRVARVPFKPQSALESCIVL